MSGFGSAILPTTFKKVLPQGLMDFTNSTGNDFKVALGVASPAGTYDATFQKFGTSAGAPSATNMGTDEIPNGSGYTSGGYDITAANNTTPLTSGTTAYTTPGINPSWVAATFTTSGCVIYNATNATWAAYVSGFGGAQTVTSGTFTILFPANTVSTALIRLA